MQFPPIPSPNPTLPKLQVTLPLPCPMSTRSLSPSSALQSLPSTLQAQHLTRMAPVVALTTLRPDLTLTEQVTRAQCKYLSHVHVHLHSISPVEATCPHLECLLDRTYFTTENSYQNSTGYYNYATQGVNQIISDGAYLVMEPDGTGASGASGTQRASPQTVRDE